MTKAALCGLCFVQSSRPRLLPAVCETTRSVEQRALPGLIHGEVATFIRGHGSTTLACEHECCGGRSDLDLVADTATCRARGDHGESGWQLNGCTCNRLVIAVVRAVETLHE